MEGGPYGVVIVVCAFMIQVISFGTESTIGVYNVEFLDYFHDQTVGVSLIGSINFGVYLASGPIVSLMMTKISYRKITMGGSFLVVMGLLGMRVYPYIPTMCFFFGVLTGFGNCCVYIPSHVLSGLYYDKNRCLATGISNSGSGLGGAIMPVLVGFLIEFFSWKGSIVILAGINLHLFIFCALLRKPSSSIKTTTTTQLKQWHPVDLEMKAFKTKEVEAAASIGASNSGDIYSSFSETETETRRSTGTAIDEQIWMRPSPSIVVSGASEDSPVSVKVDVQDFNFKLVRDENGHNFWGLDRSKLGCFTDTESFKTRSISSCGFGNNENTSELSTRSPSSMFFTENRFMLKSQSFIQPHSGQAKWDMRQQLNLGLQSSSLQPSVMGWRGSCLVRNEDKPHKRVSELAKHVSPLANIDTAQRDHHLPHSARHIFIFTNYGFDVYFLSNMMWNAGYTIIQSFTPEFMIEQGMSPLEASWLSGAFGFGSFIGGILGACCGNIRNVNRKLLYAFANIVMGCMMLLFPNYNNVVFFAVTLILSGLAFGVILGLIVIVLSDLIGPQSLGNGIGYLMLSNGVGAFIGPPIASLLRETTGGFTSAIFLAGALCIMGGLVMFLMPCVQTLSCQNNTNINNNNNNNSSRSSKDQAKKLMTKEDLSIEPTHV